MQAVQEDNRDLPISWMESVPFGFCMLNVNGKPHNNCSTERDSFINKINGAELYITDSTCIYQRQVITQRDSVSYPLERLDILSVTILESMTAPSPSLSSKKYPKSRAVSRAAS